MKRIALSIGVAALLVSRTLIAGNEYNESVQTDVSQEAALLDKAEQEYAKDLQDYDQVNSEKSMESDVAAFEKTRSNFNYHDQADHNNQQKMLDKEAHKELKAWKNHERKIRKQQERDARRTRRQEKHEALKERNEREHKDKLVHVRQKRALRQELLTQWNDNRMQQRHQDHMSGRYADLYKVPAWPAAAQFFEGRGLFNATVSYHYATDAYDSSGSSRDVSVLEFGEQPIRIKDIVLASKLVRDGKLTQQEFGDAPVASNTYPKPSKYLYYLADEEIQFLGRSEEYQIRFDLARYAFRNDLAIGIQLPVLYRKHRLRANLNIQSEDTLAQSADPNGIFGLVDPLQGGDATNINNHLSPNAFMRRYGQNLDLFLKDIWKEKGIDTLGGSAMGLGDVTVFLHGKINSSYFEKMVIGAKVQIPFAKKSSPHRLWCPALGNDGHTEFSIFTSILFSYRQFLNPHIFLQGLFGAPAHVEKRVPKRIANPQNGTGASERVKDLAGEQLFAFADRVELANGSDAGAIFDEFDTTIKNFGDNITTLKITTGFEMQLRVGNIIEKFLSQRGFLDTYYYFRFKATDDVRGVNLEEWNPSIYTIDTHRIEHTAGIDYSYQFDHNTRFVAGLVYTFAGINVPKAFSVRASLGFTFK